MQAENKKLAEPLKKAKEELHRLKGMLGNHEKDKNALMTTKAKLKVISKELEELRWEHEVLQQKYNQVSKERDEIQVVFRCNSITRFWVWKSVTTKPNLTHYNCKT